MVEIDSQGSAFIKPSILTDNKSTAFISTLSREDQTVLNKAIRLAIRCNTNYTGQKYMEALENAMDGRIVDLEDDIDIEYIEPAADIDPADEKMPIGRGHVVRALQMAGFGHPEIMAVKKAMETGDFSKIDFCADCYTEEKE